MSDKPIFTLRSKEKVQVTSATKVTENVYFDFYDWHRYAVGYIAEFMYYYLKVKNAGTDTEITEKIRIAELGIRREVDFQTATYLGSTINSNETDYPKNEDIFLIQGSLAIITQDGHYGLTGSDYELISND